QLEFARLQRNAALAPYGLARQEVDAQVTDLEDSLRTGPLHPARQRIQPGQQLAESERLGQIVITAAAQTLDSLVDIRQRAQDQDWRAVTRLPQRLNDAKAVDLAR